MMDKKHHHSYSGKFGIRVLQLSQLGKKSDEEQIPEIYQWAQLFKATTWEEVKALAEKNKAIKAGVVTLKQLTEDEKERERIEGRMRYESELSAAKESGQITGEKIGEERGRKIGEERGRKIGEERGKQIGEERFAALTGILLEANRLEDLQKAIKDKAFCEKLYQKFEI